MWRRAKRWAATALPPKSDPPAARIFLRTRAPMIPAAPCVRAHDPGRARIFSRARAPMIPAAPACFRLPRRVCAPLILAVPAYFCASAAGCRSRAPMVSVVSQLLRAVFCGVLCRLSAARGRVFFAARARLAAARLHIFLLFMNIRRKMHNYKFYAKKIEYKCIKSEKRAKNA